MKLGLVD